MAGAKPFKTPSGRRSLALVLVGAGVGAALLMFASWWFVAPLWRAPVVAAGGAVFGLIVARLLIRDVRKVRRR